MDLLISACGSYGDVLPMVGLGVAAQARGHRAAIIANPYFQAVIEGAGLECVPLGAADEYQELTAHPDLWHPLRGARLVLRRGAAAYLRQLFAILQHRARRGTTLLAAHGLDLASRVVHDARQIPLATVHFAPLAFRSLFDSPRFVGFLAGDRVPRWAKAAQLWAGDRWMIDPLLCPELNGLRRELGLPNVQRVYHRWIHSPQLVLGLFPDWFAAPQPDWPENVQLAGFPLWDSRPDEQLGDDVRRFLDEGEPPIAFAPGSANAQAADFFAAAVAICQRLGRRGVLLTKYRQQIPRALPTDVRHFEFVPFSRLLPRTAAVVHHAGIGTCAQSLASGTPQLAMPMAFDQFDNAERLRRLGVGASVPARRFTAERAAAALDALLASPTTAEQCRTWSLRCDGRRALESAVDALEAAFLRAIDAPRETAPQNG